MDVTQQHGTLYTNERRNKMNKTIFTVIIGLVICAFLVSALPPYEIYNERIAFNPTRNATIWASHHWSYNISDGRQQEKWEIYPTFQNAPYTKMKITFHDNNRIDITASGGVYVNGVRVGG